MYKALITIAVALVPAVAAAQGSTPRQTAPPAHPRIEVWLGGRRVPATTGGTVQSDYAPPLVNGTGTGRASQTLTVESSASFGLEVGARVFLTPHLGLEASGARSSSALSGANAPYSLALEYETRQPPDYQLRTYRYARTVDWHETEGEQQVTTVSVGPVIGWSRKSGLVSGTVSGGLRMQRYTGPVTSLAYTAFRLGGHSTLFYSQHRVDVEPDPDTWCAGPYLSGDLRVRFAARASLAGGVRIYLGSSPQRVPARVVGLVDPNDDVFVPDLATVESALEPGAMGNIPVTRWQVFAGIVFVLK